MTAYALIFVNFPAGATLDEVAVLYHSDMSAFYWHCLLLQHLIQTSSPHDQHHHHDFHDQHNDQQHHQDQHQVPANMTSISGLTPSRPMALSTSFLLGFSDACFITQVESSSMSASSFSFIARSSAGLISGHLSSGRSVEAASTGSIWHFQVSPG